MKMIKMVTVYVWHKTDETRRLREPNGVGVSAFQVYDNIKLPQPLEFDIPKSKLPKHYIYGQKKSYSQVHPKASKRTKQHIKDQIKEQKREAGRKGGQVKKVDFKKVEGGLNI